MALTLPTENRLKDAGLIAFFEKHKQVWTNTAHKTYEFVKSGFPTGTAIRRDDVAGELGPLVEVNEDLRAYLKEKKLKQKLWIGLFADLVIDRTWDEITKSAPAPATKPAS